MKKIIAILLCLFIVTGCDNKIDMNNYDLIVNKFLNKNTSLANNYSVGYKYYLPTGVKVVESKDFNEKLYYNGYNYYMFVDIVSYYYKNDINYTPNDNSIYSKNLEFNGIKGYIEISKSNDLYKISMYYNYSKIEAYVNEEDLGQNLINICTILNSIKFNDSVIDMYVGSNDITLNEETYDFYKPRKEGNFINYINQYDEYEDVEINENNIGNEGNE